MRKRKFCPLVYDDGMTGEHNDATESWGALAAHIETFLEKWEASGMPPDLRHHLPPDEASELRRLTLIELIKVDLEYRLQHDVTLRRLEDYAAEYPELLVDDQLPTDLIYEEFHIRKAGGQTVEPAEYFERFPQHESRLRRLMGLDAPDAEESFKAARQGPVELQPGETVDDFDLLLQLGKGSFASVYLARQRSMQRLVALKVSKDVGTEPQTLAQFDHPNIVRVYDTRTAADRGVRLLYMQYVAGGTLQNVVRRVKQTAVEDRFGLLLFQCIDAELERTGQTLSADPASRRRLERTPWPEVVCRLGAQLARALHYAYEKGSLHRDVKPANVLLTPDGSPKLADFNISFSSEVEGDDPASHFGGSLAYMAPEQLEACNPSHPRKPADLGARADLYSLAMMLWELLEGVRPYRDVAPGGSWTNLLQRMHASRAEALQVNRNVAVDDLAGQLRLVLARCLSPDPADRYPTGEEMARDLELCMQPEALRLLRRPVSGWRLLVRRWPVLTVVLAALGPNALAGVFNWFYNKNAIIEQLREQGEHVTEAFFGIQLVINSVAFPVGVAILGYIVQGVARNIDRDVEESLLNEEELAATRATALKLGSYAAIIGVVEWLLAALAYPVSMHYLVGQFDQSQYIHFFLSLALCGLVAATYPFFFISFLSLRVCYPALLRKNLAAESDEPALLRLSRQAGLFLLAAGVVPAIGVLSSVLLEVAAPETDTKMIRTITLVVLSLLGVLGFGVAFQVYRRIQNDIAALLQVATPRDTFPSSTGTSRL